MTPSEARELAEQLTTAARQMTEDTDIPGPMRAALAGGAERMTQQAARLRVLAGRADQDDEDDDGG